MTRQLTLMMLIMTLANCGCDSADERLAQFAERSVEQQAQQNAEMSRQQQLLAQQHEQLTAAAKQLVTADAESRKALIAALESQQQELAAQQSRLDAQRTGLDAERRTLSRREYFDPLLAAAFTSGALLLASLLPLWLCWRLLSRVMPSDADAALCELLVTEIVAERPKLLPAPPANRLEIAHPSDDDAAPSA